MRLYQPTYREKTKNGGKGKKKQVAIWWLEFRDANEIIQRWGLGTTDKDVADIVAAQINSLNEWAKKGLNPPEDLVRWVRGQELKLRGRIYRAGLLQTEQANSTKPILEHLEDYIENKALSSSKKNYYVQQVDSSIKRIISGCGFIYWSDVDGHKINQFIGKLIREHKMSRNTGNHYAIYFKGFATWLKRQGRITEIPVIESISFEQAQQRAFEYDEWSRLLEATKKAPTRFGLTGFQRYILYKLALDSGLRKEELANLTRTSFDFKCGTVFVPGKNTKNGKDALQKLTPGTRDLVQDYAKNKMPSTKLFIMPKRPEKMIREDCESAGIKTENYRGRIKFHTTRHTLATFLADKGVQPRVLQKIMRHADISTTMRYYTHLMSGSESAAIGKLQGIEKDTKEKSA